MAGMTKDGYVYQYGTGDGDQPIGYGVGANQQLYYGEVALVAGSGSVTTGYLKNAATAGNADLVIGMVDEPAGGTYVKTGPGILGGSTDGMVQVNVKTGTFFFQSGSGADQLSAATNGKTVYYGGENSTGPLAMATNGSGTRPVLGVQFPQDPGMANGFSPGASYWPITINPNLGRP
jgi:hypothetical protein